jgi:DNA-binding SARP family transcriptional activator
MLRIRAVGELGVELGERRLGPIASGRARSLLAWLACHPGLHPRTRVASVFWPDVLETSARASLRTTLTTLRRELGEEAAAHVVAGRERIGLEGTWVDVREVERLAGEGRHAEALALCDGELLADLDDDWVLEARQAFRARVAGLLAALGEEAAASGHLETAVAHARRRLELDPLSEDAARTLMRRLAGRGDRAAALAAFEAFRTALRRDLGLVPAAETRALAEELRAEPVEARVRPLPAALVHAEHTPLVGRREPLAGLRTAWHRASAGSTGVVVIIGEAGSGKTRLLAELAGEVRAEGAIVLAGRCLEDGLVAFAPFTEALRGYVGGASGLPEWVVTELARLLPELDGGTSPPEGDPQDARHRLFEAVAAAIGHAARGAPVLLVVEDLHWADAATAQMLAHVIRTVAWAPLLVAGSLRDERPVLADLRREARVETIALAGLSEAEVGELAAAWVDAPAGLAAALHGRTGGNPLFVEELVRHLVETHSAETLAAAVGARPDALVEAARTAVPEGVRAVIEQRLARLPEPTGQAVKVAAVAGEDFTLGAVAAAMEAADDAVADGLEEAVGAGLVDEAGVPGRYRFAHALIREAVLATLPPTRRALLDRRLAEILEEPVEVARHLLDARPLVDADTAARAALRAAAEATRRLGYEDAAGLLERAVVDELDEPRRAELLLALGDARQRMGVPAEDCYEAAAAIGRELGDADLLGRAALGAAGLTVIVGPVRENVRALLAEALNAAVPESPLRPRLLARLAIEVYRVPPATLRERLSAEALAAGRRAGGRAPLEALGARHVALWSPDHTEERLRIADELVATARSVGDREAELQGVNWRVVDLFELGEFEAAKQAVDEHERLAGELRLLAYAWYVPLWRAMLALLGGRLDEAERLIEEGARIGRMAGDENAALLFGVQRLAIRHFTGRLTGEEHAEIVRGSEHRPPGAAYRVWLADIALGRGDIAGAAEAVRREVAGLMALPLDAEWLYTVNALGLLAGRLGDAAAASTVYALLLPYRERIVLTGRAMFCAGSPELALGLLAATLGDRAGATAHLEAAVRRNEALGAVAYARAAREALAGRVTHPHERPAPA